VMLSSERTATADFKMASTAKPQFWWMAWLRSVNFFLAASQAA